MPARTTKSPKNPGPSDARPPKTALAVGAHPDDIEFLMAGTLLLLKGIGAEIHYLNLASGNLGSLQYDARRTAQVRGQEARQSARLLGAHYHPPFCGDLEILYDLKLVRRLAAVIREIEPDLILTHSPNDYMEDHQNACRLTVTAAFVRGAVNFVSVPRRQGRPFDLTVYHSMPHGLRDALGRKVLPGCFVNVTAVQEQKLTALQQHRSQQHWLGATQKLNSYTRTMVDMSREMGRQSGKFPLAEGWRRHSHLGFCLAEADPLQHLGRDYLPNPAYRKLLETPYI